MKALPFLARQKAKKVQDLFREKQKKKKHPTRPIFPVENFSSMATVKTSQIVLIN